MQAQGRRIVLKILLVAVNAKYIHTCPAIYSLRAYALEQADRGQLLRQETSGTNINRLKTELSGITPSETQRTEMDQPEMRRQDIRIDLAEYTINDRYSDVLSGIMAQGADVIGFSTYIWNVDRVRRLIRDIRKIRGNQVRIWAGGPEATYYPEGFLAEDGADLCMLGEGEEVFAELVKGCEATAAGSLENGSGKPGEEESHENDEAERPDKREWKLPERGVAYMRDGKLIHTGLAAPVDMNRIPFLYEDLSLFSNRILYYESSRGCPFSCAYCLSGRERGIRYRSWDVVRRELQFFLDRKVRQVKLIDRTFNANAAFALRLWRFLKEHENGITNFHFEIEADRITDEQIGLLGTLRPGLIQMEIGVQSANPQTLKAVHRKPDLTRIREVMAELVPKQNINLHLDLIAGLPYEDLASFRRSFNTVYGMRPHQLQLGFLKLLKGTELFDRREEYGLVCSDDAPYEVLCTKWLSYEEIALLQRISDRVEEYVNSQGFRRSLPLAEKLFPDAFAMFEALAEYYRREGYEEKHPSVQRRYEIFARFVEEAFSGRTDGAGEEMSGPGDHAMSGSYTVKYETGNAMPEPGKNRHETGDAMSGADEKWLLRLKETIRFDQALHVHPSRRMMAEETFDFGEGPEHIQFDYRECSPVNGEAKYFGSR